MQKTKESNNANMSHRDKRQSNNQKGRSKVQINENNKELNPETYRGGVTRRHWWETQGGITEEKT